MIAEHTQGTIRFQPQGNANEYVLYDEKDHWWMSVRVNGTQLTEQQEANLRRLVACWNAFQDYSTVAVEELAGHGEEGGAA